MRICFSRVHQHEGLTNAVGCKLLAVSGSLGNVANSITDQRGMKAAIWTNYGGPEVLQLATVPVSEPRENEILIRIAAANIFTGDAERRQFKVHPSLWLLIRLFMGVFKPRIKILGHEFCGTVLATGNSVERFAVGDQVFGSTGADLHTLCKQISGKNLEASIDETYELEDIVEAHRYIDTGQKKGHVALLFENAIEH